MQRPEEMPPQPSTSVVETMGWEKGISAVLPSPAHNHGGVPSTPSAFKGSGDASRSVGVFNVHHSK